MKKNQILLAGSFVLLAATIVYINSQKDQKITPTQQSQPTTEILKVEPVVTEKGQETLIEVQEQETIIAQETKAVEKKKQVLQDTKVYYTLSELPENMSIATKKERFFQLLIPAIEKNYNQLEKEYNEVQSLIENGSNNKKVLDLMKSYNAKDSQDLLKRLKPHPKSIAIAQAAIQSGWATSRFTLIANNLFGVWSFDEQEPRVEAYEKRGEKTIYVKRYASLEESIKDYYKLLATSDLFEEFRELKMKTNDPYIILESLENYYKKGDNFAEPLSEMIKYNELEKYDN